MPHPVRATFLFIIVLSSFLVGVAYGALAEDFSVTWNAEASVSIQTTPYYAVATDGELAHYFGRSFFATEEDPSESGRFNFTDQSWTEYPRLPVTWELSCIVPLPNGDIYITGGAYDDGTRVQNTTVFKLASNANSYTEVAPMNVGRFGHTCAYDAATNRIYVIGGRTAPFSLLLSGEYYSISENKWTMIADYPAVNPGYSLINVGDGYLYAIGGSFSKDVKRYSIVENSWTTIGTMNIQSDTKLLSYLAEENVIVSVGGSNDTFWCEYFSLDTNTATTFACLESTNSSIYNGARVGTFIPERREFYLLNLGKLWKGNVTFVPPTPEAAPDATNEPNERPQYIVPIADTPTGTNAPSPNTGTPSSRTPRSNVASSAARVVFGVLGAVGSWLAIAVVSLV